MSEVRLFGESISNEVIQQIELRERIIAGTGTGGNSVLKTNTRSVKDIQQFSGRTAWIRMISSVDVLNNQGTPTPAQAKNFILSGGELQVRRNTVKRKSGVSFQAQDRSSVYRKSDNLGVRPEAGITSFDIKHKGTYGSLREANISFNVWTREDLDRAQNIYLRPGVHMIVEWGHTVYRDSTNGNNKQPSFPNTDKFFEVGTRDGIQEIIQEYRRINSLNYDGFIGLVSNFSWSFRPDGGYDCTVKIVSAGSLLESIGIETGASTTDEDGENEDESNLVKELGISIFHLIEGRLNNSQTIAGFFDEILIGTGNVEVLVSKASDNTFVGVKEGNTSRSVRFNRLFSKFENDIKELPGFFLYRIRIPEDDSPASNKNLIYLSLSDTLNLLFSHITTEETKKILPTIELNPEQRFKTFPEHFSIDPSTCLLPVNADTFREEKILSGLIDQAPALRTPLFQSKEKTIANIFINNRLVRDKLDSILKKGTSDLTENNAFDLIRDILKDVNTALGSVTELDLHFNEFENKYVIVDRGFPNIKNSNDVKDINITGLKNTVKDISIETKITSNLASMIAISAQGTKSVTGNDLTSNIGMVQWNKDIRDRFTQIKTDEQIPFQIKKPSLQQEVDVKSILQRILPFGKNPLQVSEDLKVIKPFQEVYINLFVKGNEREGLLARLGKFIGTKPLLEPREFKEEIFRENRRYAVKYFREKYFESIGGNSEEDFQETSDPGLIPVQLSITMDGIAGFVIGQVFKIKNVERVLPENYKNYGFILTAIDHSISGGRWETTIKALTFKLPK